MWLIAAGAIAVGAPDYGKLDSANVVYDARGTATLSITLSARNLVAQAYAASSTAIWLAICVSLTSPLPVLPRMTCTWTLIAPLGLSSTPPFAA